MIFENDNYRIVIADSPGKHTFECYGILNKKTQVIEAYIGQLALAILTCKQYDRELVEGIKTERELFEEFKEAIAEGKQEEAVFTDIPTPRRNN